MTESHKGLPLLVAKQSSFGSIRNTSPFVGLMDEGEDSFVCSPRTQKLKRMKASGPRMLMSNMPGVSPRARLSEARMEE